jgi:diguanylate cyclase (GGDEF)-like protein
MVKLQEEVHRAERYNKVLSVVMADLDHFKRVNDTYGHAAGDSVLQALGRFLRRNVREIDIIGRYGGEEFVFLLPDADKDSALRMAERLRQGLATLPFGELPGCTLSLGIATFPADALKADDLIRLADTALYAAKQAGRNRTHVYSSQTPPLPAEALRRPGA